MQGPAHLAIGWLIGQSAGLAARRDRRIIGLAGLIPDIDVVSYPLAYAFFAGDLDRAYSLYVTIHHRYTHGIVFALAMGAAAYCLATPSRRGWVGVLACVAVIAHILCDVIASGPNWPVYPGWPVSAVAWTVPWSWPASDWRNIGLSFLAIAMTLAYARLKGYSPVECFSFRADAWMAAVMRGEVRSSPRFRIVLYTVLLLVSALVVIPLWFYL